MWYSILKLTIPKGNLVYLKKSKYANGRIFLSICESYRDKVQKKSKSRTVLKVGYLDVLELEQEDPIAHY